MLALKNRLEYSLNSDVVMDPLLFWNLFFLLLLLSFHDDCLLMQTCKDATQAVANLQRQQVHSQLIASDYMEAN